MFSFESYFSYWCKGDWNTEKQKVKLNCFPLKLNATICFCVQINVIVWLLLLLLYSALVQPFLIKAGYCNVKYFSLGIKLFLMLKVP